MAAQAVYLSVPRSRDLELGENELVPFSPQEFLPPPLATLFVETNFGLQFCGNQFRS